MYNAQTTKKRIMDLCKNQSAEQMLKDCSLGVNAIRQINDTKGMASFSLAKIADYLDVSVDYLLGRTDNPQAHKTQNVVYGDLSNNSGIVGNVGSTITTAQNGQAAALLEMFNSLDPIKQAQLVVYANELNKE